MLKNWNKLSILSFLLGTVFVALWFSGNSSNLPSPILLLLILAIPITGLKAYSQIKKTKERGKYFAITGMAVGVILILALVILAIYLLLMLLGVFGAPGFN